MMDGGPSRPLERERRPRLRDLLGWTLPASRHVAADRRGAAAMTPWGRQRMEPARTSLAERPRRRAAACAAGREDDVEGPGQHRPTIRPWCDRTRPVGTTPGVKHAPVDAGGVRAGRSRSLDRPRER
jgi:hypothetical protein